jgi:hypothetical protein
VRAVLTILDPITGGETDIPVRWVTGFDTDAMALVPKHLRREWDDAASAVSRSAGWIKPYGGLPYRVAPANATTTATGIFAIGSYLTYGRVRWKKDPPYPRLPQFDPDEALRSLGWPLTAPSGG